MAFMNILSHFLTAWFALLLPAYSTWKTIAHRNVELEPQLQRWSKYWTVIGVFIAFEYVAEWFISWVPFYWEAKVVFMLFLSLPQTEGSSYIYDTYLEPFFLNNERSLDSGILRAQNNTFVFVKEHAAVVVNLVVSLINKTPRNSQNGVPATNGQAPGGEGLNLNAAMGLFNSVANAMHKPNTTTEKAPITPPAAQRNSFQSESSEFNGLNRRSVPRTPEGHGLPNLYDNNSYPATNAGSPQFPQPQY